MNCYRQFAITHKTHPPAEVKEASDLVEHKSAGAEPNSSPKANQPVPVSSSTPTPTPAQSPKLSSPTAGKALLPGTVSSQTTATSTPAQVTSVPPLGATASSCLTALSISTSNTSTPSATPKSSPSLGSPALFPSPKRNEERAKHRRRSNSTNLETQPQKVNFTLCSIVL